jgi:diguanylate cyclase (GGDEF)-like protein
MIFEYSSLKEVSFYARCTRDQRRGNKDTGEINNRVNEILAEVETSARYAKALKNNFMWHDKKKSLRKDVQNAGVDFLTGIPWREGYGSAMRIRTFNFTEQRHRSQEEQSWLFTIDCDNFKEVNDTYGHPVGDFVLQEVARIIQNNLREGDYFARIWGDEFKIIVDGCNPEWVSKIWEKIRRAIEWNISHEIKWEQVLLWITLSIGICSFKEKIKDTEETSDKALYSAKTRGRNAVVIFTSQYDLI